MIWVINGISLQEPSKLLDGSNVGTWNTDDCETHYDHFTDNPRIWCACEHSSRAFTVLAVSNANIWVHSAYV